jgi:DNA-binding CsgD family transcriptional regulator
MNEIDDTIDLWAAIRRAELTERQHTILMLWLVGHTHSEVAQIIGVKRPAVTRQISRIVKTLSCLM